MSFTRTLPQSLKTGRLSMPTRNLDGKDRELTVLGVRIADVSMTRALETVRGMIRRPDGKTRCIYFVNAHALNIAASDGGYRQVLNAADRVFGDGTGVRWAARLQGIRLCDNVNGTDFVPRLLANSLGEDCRYFLLGTDETSIQRAAKYAAATFPQWTLAGFHHGYLTTPETNAEAIEAIRRSRPDVLLVGMGNPLQEQWIHRHRDRLEVPVCLGVGGLFQYWAGTLRRAHPWLRAGGFEWLGILAQQPIKAQRYLIGNPLFLARVSRDAWNVRRRERGFSGRSSVTTR